MFGDPFGRSVAAVYISRDGARFVRSINQVDGRQSGFWNTEAIERLSAHIDPGSVRRAYARADY
jgi:hypothetical protein